MVGQSSFVDDPEARVLQLVDQDEENERFEGRQEDNVKHGVGEVEFDYLVNLSFLKLQSAA